MVFPCAALADAATGRIAIYYGCADTVTGLAFTTADRLMEDMEDAGKMAADHPESALWELCGHSLDRMDAKMPFDAASSGDCCGKRLVEHYIGHHWGGKPGAESGR